jgi:F0F1-type ATP synthase assembly protein I
MYILPPYRFTSYAIGISTGFFFRQLQDIKISSKHLYFAWTAIFTILAVVFRLVSVLANEDYEYSAIHAAAITFLPIPFCVFFVLAIYTAEMKFSSKLAGSL